MKKTILLTILSTTAIWGSPAFAKSSAPAAAPAAEPVNDLVIPPALVTAKSGRPASADLKIKTSKVPAFEIYQKKVVKGKVEVFRVKSIPRLDVGEEPTVAATENKPIALPATRAPANVSVVRLTSPSPISVEKFLTKGPVAPAADAKAVVQVDPAFKAPAVAALDPFQPPQFDPIKPEVTNLENMSPVQLKLLQALIFLEVQKSYNMALALFSELTDDKEVATEATYQLGLTSKALGLYSEYKTQMMKVLKANSKDWQKKATISLAQSAQQGDLALVSQLDPRIEDLKLEYGQDIKDADQYQMNRAKYYLEKNNLTMANAAVEEVPLTSPLALDSQFLHSVILYKGGQLQEAIQLQTQVVKTLMEKNPQSELKSIAALTLARMHFQASQYKEAYDTYLKVDKTNPEWTQAMIEQAWSQILAEDYEGAAGNMFSLHTDFFKNSFAPESYVIRTVGYLNLCQYGDGARVISEFKRKYAPVQKQMAEYTSHMNSESSYYDTVKTFAKNPDQKMVDGLPRNFIFELARHPSFVSEQKMINSSEDEIARYNKITLELIKKERDIIKAQNDVRAQFAEIKKKMDKATAEQKVALTDEYNFQNKRLLSYQIQLHIAKRARGSIKELRAQGIARLDEDKKAFKTKANQAIKTRFNAMLTTLKNTLDQSEVLNYELYAGAGEHIRYQMAGGDITDKEHQELKPEEKKSVQWEFKGEVWEDELGHYRSGLKNVCPHDGISQAEVGK